jgi:hypothetical protein
MNTIKSGHWHVDGNQVNVCVVPFTNLLDYSRLIDGAVLYGLLRRGDWTVYLTPGSMVGVMLSTYEEVHHYKMKESDFYTFVHYYCGQKLRELDWRKCGF